MRKNEFPEIKGTLMDASPGFVYPDPNSPIVENGFVYPEPEPSVAKDEVKADKKTVRVGENGAPSRPEITKRLSEALERHINPSADPRIYLAKEVSFVDPDLPLSVRVDYIQFKPVNQYSYSGIEKGLFYCYEIKSSVADFHSKHGHNFIGDYNYYVMPENVYEKVSSEIRPPIGVFVEKNGDLVCKKKGRRQRRIHPASYMLFSMYRSAQRDVLKVQRPDVIDVEQLKKIPTGTWIYIKATSPWCPVEPGYYKKQPDCTNGKSFCFGHRGIGYALEYYDYRRKWVVYRVPRW